MSALDAHTTVSTQSLNSQATRRGLKELLLEYAELYDARSSLEVEFGIECPLRRLTQTVLAGGTA